MSEWCVKCGEYGVSCKCHESEQNGSKSALSEGLDGPMSYEYNPDKFEKFVLDYTTSTTWEQIRDLDWTTAEMLDLVKQYMDKNKAD
ncbi:hypothetical protein KAR91_57545 [Candidatus Pacearchaeota archaeon]|nr:hypothetical protein [Candidatus Pacearchaeota archaeon]